MSPLRSNLLLLLVAFIWGSAFVAQKIGSETLGALTFNGVRFLIGSLCLVPFLWGRFGRGAGQQADTRRVARDGFLLGVFIFLGAGCQQIGLSDTTGGKAAFITGLFVVIVPVLGIFFRQAITMTTALGSLLAVTGLYFLCVKGLFTVARGDLFELGAAFFWALQILLMGRLASGADPFKLAFFQFITAALLSLGCALVFEAPRLPVIVRAAWPILYCGIFSIGFACTAQVIAQKNARPAHAAIILSLQTVAAVMGGALFLGEKMGLREMSGCALMFAGMLLSQMELNRRPSGL